MITDLPTKRIYKCYHSDKHLLEFYLQDSGKNQLASIYGTKLRHCHSVFAGLAGVTTLRRL